MEELEERAVCTLGRWVLASVSMALATLGGSANAAMDDLHDLIRNSLELPLAVQRHVSPATAPDWMRGFLGDVEIVSVPDRPGDPASATMNRLRQARAEGRRDVAEKILRTIGSQLDHRPDFVLLEAEIWKSADDAAALRRCIEKPGWSTMRAARCAYRLWLARDEPHAREALGSEVAREAAADPDARVLVGALLESWGFPEVAAEIWILVAASDHPAHDYARTHVMSLAMRSGYTPLLLRLCDALARKRPGDADARFTRVYLSLLLREESADLINEAKALHAAKPESPSIASLLAYALLRSGDRTAALEALTGVELSALQNRPESLIGALVLESADPARARTLAESSAACLRLPEEKVLFRSVLERLRKGQVN